MTHWPLLLALLLMGCERDPLGTARTNNPQVPVEHLFDHDGCSVYRFDDDGLNHYFVRCASTVTVDSAHAEVCGKGCVHQVPEEIQTVTR